MNGIDAVVLAAYASLVVELVLFPIPSEASTWQLVGAGTGESGRSNLANALQQARSRSLVHKLVCYLLPTALGVLAWLVPLASVVVPAVGEALWCTRPPALVVPGLALVVLGRAITFVSVLQLRTQRRSGGAPGWLFRRSRNPGLVGMFACYVGLCCLFSSPLLWLVLPLYVGNMHGRVRMEEAHLGERLGEDWREYAARVPRYLGW